MNYIKHLTGFFHKINGENSLNPTHISLYLALFQCWNVNRFNNPTAISRDEIMKASKINSKVTYHKCIKELQSLGFVEYLPSFNPHAGSVINMINLSEELKPKPKFEPPTVSNFDQYNELVNGQVDDQVYIYNNKQTQSNITNIDISQDFLNAGVQFLNFDLPKKVRLQKFDNNNPDHENGSQKKSCAKKKEKWENPSLDEIHHFFNIQKVRDTEADKFFNYYTSKGWLIGGKSKMRDWQAAARNWILNLDKFKTTKPDPQAKVANLNTAINKDYAEPL